MNRFHIFGKTGFFAGVLLWASLATGAERPDKAGAGLHRRLDVSTMGRTLQKLRMGALLEALAEETGDRRLQIEALLFQADAAEPARREELLTRAAETIRTEYEALGKKIEETPSEQRRGDAFDESLLAWFQLRLRYVQVQVLQRGKAYIDRLTFLLGGESDRQALENLVSPAMKLLDRAQEDLRVEIGAAREDTDKTKMVYLVPELEDVQGQMDFTAGKLRYYAAIVLPETIRDSEGKVVPNPKRESLLDQSIRDLQRFAEDPDLGVQPFAMLQQGRAERLRGRFDKAAEKFAFAAGEQSEPDVIVEALFEIVLNETDRAVSILQDKARADRVAAGGQAFARAEKTLEEFRRRAPQTGHPELGVDVKALVLGHHLYDHWAAALRAAGQDQSAEDCENKARQVFAAFLEKYKDPGIQAAVGALFREKFRGKEIDPTHLAPGIVVLLATMDMQEASGRMAGRNVDALEGPDRQVVEELLNRAEKMLLALRDGQSPRFRASLPDALWKLGVLYVQKNENFPAGEMFRRLVREFPQHPQAKDAAINAVKIANQLIAGAISQGQNVSPQRRRELIESIRVLLKHWPDDPEAARYHFDLAWQCEKLAETEGDDSARQAWLKEAVENYQAVPADSPDYHEARFCALELLYRQLLNAPDGDDRRVRAEQLRTALAVFGGEMYALWQQETDAKKKADLGLFGSTSEFHAEILAHDVLGRKDESLSRIEALPTRWPGTAVLREGGEFAIRSRLARGEVQQALTQFESFRQKYGDEQAQELMREVVDKLRQAIFELSLERGKEEQIKRFRDAYVAFARQVYQTSLAGASEEDRYYLTLLYADSLVQTGTAENAQKALDLYEGLHRTDAQRRERANAKIAAEFAELHQQVRAARGRDDQLATMRGKLAETLRAHGLQSWRNAAVEEVEYLFQQQPSLTKAEEKRDMREMIYRALAAAFQATEQHLLQQAPIDATVLMGQARCHETLRQYARAAEEYSRLAQGLDPNRPETARSYWEAQLGYSRSYLELYRKEPAKLTGLLDRLRTLRNGAPQQWVGRLNLIEVEVDRIVQQGRS